MNTFVFNANPGERMPAHPFDKAALIPLIESGEIEHLEFEARVFRQEKNRNHYRFLFEEIPSFAGSFEGRPFLRNHDTEDIASRDGLIMR